MAKQIRTRYVYKKYNRVFRYLPRRQDGYKEFDYEQHLAGPDHFAQPMDAEPPKLWLAWMYRPTTGERTCIKNRYFPRLLSSTFRLTALFGKDCQPGKMAIFKNTADVNEKLWEVKHMIELRPMTFPNGEPREEDVPFLEVRPDGSVVIDREAVANPLDVHLTDPKKQFTPGQLGNFYKKRDTGLKDVYPDTVYNPANVTILD